MKHLIAGFFVVLSAVLWSAQAYAAAITIDTAADEVDITTGFTGDKVIVYGTISGGDEVAVMLRGPEQTMKVRRKSDVMGMWLNTEEMKFRRVPVYYNYALSAPAPDIASPEVLLRYGIGLDALRFAPDAHRVAEDKVRHYQEALIRNKQTNGTFPLEPQPVEFIGDGFFRVELYVPAHVPMGFYELDAYLFEAGEVVDSDSAEVVIKQVGMGASIYLFAHNWALAYGLLCVVFALFAGWLSNEVRQRI